MRSEPSRRVCICCLGVALVFGGAGGAQASACAYCDLPRTSNLLANAGFEDGEGQPVATNWTLLGSAAREDTNTYGFTATAMFDGDYGVKGWGSDMNAYQTNIPVTGGRAYEASGYFYHSSVEDVISNSLFSTRMFMVVEWFDALGSSLGLDFSANHNGTWPGDVWTQITRCVTAPTNAARATFRVETDNDVGTGSVFGDGFFFGEYSHPGMGWQGRILIDGESLDHWYVDSDQDASGTVRQVSSIAGLAVELDWGMGTGSWVQARYDFPEPMDLSAADMIGVSLRGGGSGELCNQVGLVFIDTNDSVYRYDFYTENNGVNQLDRWLINISLPRTLFLYSWGPSPIDWSCIDRFMLIVEKPGPSEGGGEGLIALDHLQWDRAADWPRQATFETVTSDPVAASNTIAYMINQQKVTGLILSWKEEAWHSAYLYDQALALIALTREGGWHNLVPTNQAALTAQSLAGFLLAEQKPDGRWARCWDPNTGNEKILDAWVGDQAWAAMAMSVYAQKSGDTSAWAAANANAAWVASQIDGSGKATDTTEGNLDVWWAMLATLRFSEADDVEDYLVHTGPVWDSSMKYLWGSSYNPHVLADCASWLAPFARHPRVSVPSYGRDALTFVNKALRVTSEDGALCGLSLQGPLTIFNEWTAQYVAAGGQHAQELLDTLLSQQNPDGSMPAAADEVYNDALGWGTTWSGLAPTAWLYFALTGDPFPAEFRPARSGTVAYHGAQTGLYHVVADTHAGPTETTLPEAGLHCITGLALYTNYWFAAYRDSNGNGMKDEWEAQFEYTNNPVFVSNIAAGIDIMLEDPDLDVDGLPDYWEWRFFGHRDNCAPGVDADGDGSSNAEEFGADTNPTNPASVFTNRIARMEGADVCTVYTRPGTTNSRLYHVYWASNLLDGVEWIPVGGGKTGDLAGAALQFSVTNTDGCRFYRTGVRTP